MEGGLNREGAELRFRLRYEERIRDGELNREGT